MNSLWLIVMLFCGVPLYAQTQEFPETSGNAFLRLCSVVEKVRSKEEQTTTEFGQVMACIGYVSGFKSGVEYEAFFAMSKTKRKEPAPFCIPEDVEHGQTVLVVLKYIRDNPENAHKATAILIMDALGKVYPCPTK